MLPLLGALANSCRCERQSVAARACARMRHTRFLDVKHFFFFPLVVIEMQCLRFAPALMTPPLGFGQEGSMVKKATKAKTAAKKKAPAKRKVAAKKKK